jgi:uncharacterized protein
MKVTRESNGDMVIITGKHERCGTASALTAAAQDCIERADRFLILAKVSSGRERAENTENAKYMLEESDRLFAHAKAMPSSRNTRDGIETRHLPYPDVQRRSAEVSRSSGTTSTGEVATGYGSVFYRAGEAGTEYQLGENLMERIHPNAFDRALRELKQSPVRAAFNHDPAYVMANTNRQTLRLSVDQRGLRYSFKLGSTDKDNFLRDRLGRGIVDGSSFSFRPLKQRITRGIGSSPDVRTIEDMQLFELGPVTFPAYSAATAGLV